MATPKPERLKAADVCQIAQVQPYVLRTWEAEFPDLGKSTAGGPRLYSRADVERVLQIRALVYGEGLTMSGARRRLEEVAADTAPAARGRAGDFSLLDAAMRDRLKSIRAGLVGVLTLLERPLGPEGFTLVATTERPTRRAAPKAARRTGR